MKFIVACLLPLFLLISINLFAYDKNNKSVGIAIIPPVPEIKFDKNTGEKIELSDQEIALQKTHQVIGGMPHIQKILSPKSKNQMFDSLIKLKKSGVEIDHLIIGGHGARDNPSISLEAFVLFPVDLDVADAEVKKNVYDNVIEFKTSTNAGERDIEDLSQKRQEYTDRIHNIEEVKGVMSSNGTIQLFNCETLATEEGREFATNLGQILFGDKKGNIVASKTKVKVFQNDPIKQFSDYVLDYVTDPLDLLKIAKYISGTSDVELNDNEFYASGDWETISINGGDKFGDGTDVSEDGGGAIRDKQLYGAATLHSDPKSEAGSSNSNENTSDQVGTQQCTGQSVKLSDETGHIQCVSCDVLYGDFNAALDANEKNYAQSLLDFSAGCGWAAEGRTRIDNIGKCLGNTVRLSDESNNVQCVPCDSLYGDFVAAMGSGETSYAESLVDLAGECGWSRAAAQKLRSDTQQARLDKKCSQKIPGSHAVIAGDQYRCYCDAGMLVLSGSNGKSCQSCEQIRGLVNSALQKNNFDNVRGLMGGAQSCGWYDEAVQVMANLDQKEKRKKAQQFENIMTGILGLTTLYYEYDRYIGSQQGSAKNNKTPSKASVPQAKKKAPPQKQSHRPRGRYRTESVIIDARP